MHADDVRSGVDKSFFIDIPSLSHLFGPLYGTYRVYWMLAHVLSRMLVALSWFNEIVSHLQEDHGCLRSQKSLLVELSGILTSLFSLFVLIRSPLFDILLSFCQRHLDE